MGVSVFMRPGSIMRSMGEPVNITPGCRSQFVDMFRQHFGDFPAELHQDDVWKLELMAAAASVYADAAGNVWMLLFAAVHTYNIVTVTAEY